MRIKELRNKMGLTQQQLADSLCIDRALLARYENGSRIPPLKKLDLFADFFGVTVDYLVGREEEPIKEKPAESDLHAAAHSLLDQMPEQAIKDIIQFMEFKRSQKTSAQ